MRRPQTKQTMIKKTINLLVILFLLFSITSCNKKVGYQPIRFESEMDGMTLLFDIIGPKLQIPINIVHMSDTNLECIPESELRNLFGEYLKYKTSFINYLGSDGMKDCDNNAELFHMFSQNLHASATKKGTWGVAVGIVWYSPDGYQYSHAVNILVVTDKDKKKKIMFIEPQSSSLLELKLSASEIKSIRMMLF